MSEHFAHKYENREDVQLILHNGNNGKSHRQCHLPWMAHWMKESSISTQGCKNITASDESNEAEYVKGREFISAIKNHERTCSKNVWRCNTNVLDVVYDVQQSVGTEKGEKGNKFLNNSMTQKDVNLFHAKAVVSNTVSVHKLPGSSVNWENVNTYHFSSSENLDSEWNHFPMLDINRKIDSILNPKRKSGNGSVHDRIAELNETMSSSHLIAFASERYKFRAQRSTEKANEEVDPSRFNGHGSKMKAYSCCEENISSSSQHLVREHSINTNFTNLKHELNSGSGHRKFSFSGMRSDNKVVASSFRSRWSRMNGEISLPSISSESDTEILNDSIKKNNPFSSLHSFETQEMNSMDSERGGSINLSNETELLLTEKTLTNDSSHRKRLIVGSTDFGNGKRPSLFEMLTLPAASHDAQNEDSQRPQKSKICEVYGNGRIGTHDQLLKAQSKSSVRNRTMEIADLQAPSSFTGIGSSGTRKDITCPNSRKSGPVEHTISRDTEHFNSSKRTDSRTKELSTSRAATMDANCILSHLQEPKDPNLPIRSETPLCIEPNGRWVKRLRKDLSENLPSSPKRLKTGECSSNGEMCSLFNKVLHYNKSNSDMLKYLEEHQLLDKAVQVPNNCQKSSEVSTKTMQSWIGRWCFKSNSEKSNNVRDLLNERQLPSIGALAMMGKVMNKVRPCKFERRGPSIVWNMQGS
ncbi:uncharacterized protein LOC109722044 [Ananas comosus]|uniref:Uncharacterized protein LOC109722044 n=2 Tax=Ananas comosus TaxID=4615 RepID=A0A6P5GHJ3_ANACO|nr:uncharacterized protein LOC109722044 [Ananas comosus]XP_020105488.1 uncharacterized protein LOC109722044 [Ananas comosus]XP_020105489.1 uncharacterized protein LOC109722044 [Ananas comosus]XP_020105490.1 uncharacterized protein LOC109722044 [Ananas comosus]